ncbi:MAG: hypothetical protein ACE5KM_00100 [Planctomycetaceae bacterium]
MIDGTVTIDGIPTITMNIAGADWEATIDTGFNGDLELPLELMPHVDAVYFGPVTSHRAGGQRIVESGYDVRVPFDGELREAQATFVEGPTILIGTRLLNRHRLVIDFRNRTLRLDVTQ